MPSLKQSSRLFLLLLALHSTTLTALSPDPAGESKIGNAAHQSTIGSQCLSSLDCGGNGNIACCAILPQGSSTIGICSGCGATTQSGKQGCGFGDDGKDLTSDPQVCPAATTTTPQPAAADPQPAAASPAPCARSRPKRQPITQRRQAARLPDPGLDAGAGNGQHAQFITGRCLSSLDCGAQQTDLANVCCASVVDSASGQTVGVCSGSAVGNAAPKLGCGFGDGLANSAGGSSAPAQQENNDTNSDDDACVPAAVASPPPATQAQPAKLPDPGLDAGKGNQANQQFVTGACINAKDCGAAQSDLANVCCASVMGADGQVVGVCSGSAVGNAAPKMGCGFGDGKANAAV